MRWVTRHRATGTTRARHNLPLTGWCGRRWLLLLLLLLLRTVATTLGITFIARAASASATTIATSTIGAIARDVLASILVSYGRAVVEKVVCCCGTAPWDEVVRASEGVEDALCGGI